MVGWCVAHAKWSTRAGIEPGVSKIECQKPGLPLRTLARVITSPETGEREYWPASLRNLASGLLRRNERAKTNHGGGGCR